MILTMFQNGVKTRDDLADLAGDELAEMMVEFDMSEDEANTIIMSARAHWFEDEPADDAPVAQE